MRLYRFSPIKTKDELLDAIRHVHFECYKLCDNTFGTFLPNAGNIGIFCHYDFEYDLLTKIRKKFTQESDNINQKYFRLYEPLIIPAKNGVPETTYSFLYIRKPDPYRHHVGDVDFYLNTTEYESLKKELVSGGKISGARIFERKDLDMIELFNPDIDVLAYVSTNRMTKLVRKKQSNATNL